MSDLNCKKWENMSFLRKCVTVICALDDGHWLIDRRIESLEQEIRLLQARDTKPSGATRGKMS